MKTLIAGAWLGEFGYELCKWVPYIRYLAWRGDYDHVVIVCRTGHEYLYRDFATKFYNDDTSGQTTEWLINGKEPKISQSTLGKILTCYNNTECDLIQPNKDIRDNNDKIFFLMYGELRDDIPAINVLIHARSTEKYNSGNRNWPKRRWAEIIKRYPELTFASVGTKAEANYIPKTTDLRGIPIEELVCYMKKAKILVSPSSGTAHLASLCGLPHVVWTDDKIHGVIGGHTNKERYKQLWNPFNAFASVIDTSWQPTVDEVSDKIKHVLIRKKRLIPPSQPAVIKRREIINSPIISMVTYERQDIFKKTVESLEKSNISLKNLYIFDDKSKSPYKLGFLRALKKRYKIIQHSQNLGVFVNSLIAIDFCYCVSNDKHIVYCQDDVEFSKDWYVRALKAIEQLNKDGVDWGILALLHYRGYTDRDYYIMKGGHPGGACWIINRKMWGEYRKDNVIYNIEVIGDRLVDHKLCHWCHNNEKRQWAVVYTGKSLVKHIGVKSTMHTKDMSEYEGLGYGD